MHDIETHRENVVRKPYEPLVVALDVAPADEANVVGLIGGKGAGLARLAARGFAVPPGFVVTVAAFRAYLEHHHITEWSTPEGAARAAHALKHSEWPEPLRRAVQGAYAPFGGRAVAVRSSATDEDAKGASFAGQYESFLDRRGEEAVFDAIRRCWVSLFRAEALRYRAEQRTNGGEGHPPAMAVVVQTMVDAAASGVAFTVHPVHHTEDVIVIDFCAGLGDAIAAGTTTPDQCVLSKNDFSIIQRELAGARAALADDRVVEVARLARAIELAFGGPQDVEWAIDDASGKVWALQARPISLASHDDLPGKSEMDTATSPTTTWTSTNVQEVLPGLLSPLTQTVVLRDFDAYSRLALGWMGIKPRTKEPIVGSFHGRAFLNLSLAQEIGGQTASTDKHYFGEEEETLRQSSGGTLAKLRLALALPKTIYCFCRLGAHMARNDALGGTPPGADASHDELTRRVHEHGGAHVLSSVYSGAMFTILGKLTEKFLDDKQGELHGRLLRGLAGMDSARPAYELWDLARIATSSAALRDVVQRGDAVALEALAKDAAVARFQTKLEEFLRDHGHHSIQEMELRACTWDEDVSGVLAMIRNYLDADEERAPRASEERARTDRETASRDALAKMKAWQRPLFRYFLRAAQRWVPLREHTKSLLIRAMHRRRRFFRALAQDLVGRGLIAAPHDLYYLRFEELETLQAGTLARADAERTIAQRRRSERQSRLLVLPETFTGVPVPAPREPAAIPEGGKLQGTGVSRGTVTGPARVIVDPRSDSTIHPGEILVAPVTDAGWAPLFTVAAGLVVDIGGALSHGSTVAREYGLPAVVNVRIGTRVIRTGDIVTVDGTRGVVIVEKASG